MDKEMVPLFFSKNEFVSISLSHVEAVVNAGISSDCMIRFKALLTIL